MHCSVPGDCVVPHRSQSRAVSWALGDLVTLLLARKEGSAWQAPHTVGLPVRAEAWTAPGTKARVLSVDSQVYTMTEAQVRRHLTT